MAKTKKAKTKKEAPENKTYTNPKPKEEAKKKDDPLIWVKATQRGLYGRLREEGDVFQVKESMFSKNWMEPANSPKKNPEE